MLSYARTSPTPGETLILNEEFNDFNLDLWKHEISMVSGSVFVS